MSFHHLMQNLPGWALGVLMLASIADVSTSRADEFRLMSYNILHGKGADGKVDIRRTAAAIRRENPDFVGLQEVDKGVSRSGGIDEPAELARLTGLHATFASAFPYKGGEYGRAILSREKPVSVERVRLDGKHPGVLLFCEFPGFWFATMHLDLVATNRLRQVETVRTAVAERAKTKPVFLTGDWNAPSASPTLEKMRTFVTLLSDERSTTFTGFSKQPREGYCIDFIAVDSAHTANVRVTETHVTPDDTTSDHNPVVATVVLGTPAIPVVVLPDNPTAVEKSAAGELAGELGKCLGETPAILPETEIREGRASVRPRLYVGATWASKEARGEKAWDTDEVFLKSVEDGVVMDGDPARAPLYAVDLYLEKYCGVRWWTSDASTHPKCTFVPVEGVDLRYAPQFKYRETYYLDGFDPLFKVRSKGNFTSLTRYLLHEIKFIPPELGGNHRLYFFKGRHSAYHSFFEILPPKVYFKKHPEWYSLVNGKREAKQLCLANGEMKAEYIKETLKRLREDSSVDFIQVSQNDWRGYCTCEKCKAMMDEDGGAPSGPYLRFANDVAAAVEKEFPNVRIDTFAYQFTRRAPAKTRPRHNVVVRLCDIECDFARPLAEPLPPKEAKFAKDLADWRRVAGGNLFIWDYLANFQNYMMPHPNIGSIAPNIRLFAENGAVGVFEQGDAICAAGSFAALRHYVTSHLLWDPRDDEKRLFDEFMEGYYGKTAAPILKEFIAVVEAGPRKTKQVVRCAHEGAPFLTGGDKLKAARLMDEAVAAAEREGEPFASRVRRERLSVDHMMLLNYDALKGIAAKLGGTWTRPATKAETVENWIREVKSFGVKARRETTSAKEIGNYFEKLRREGRAPARPSPAAPASADTFAPQKAEFAKYYKAITGKDAPEGLVRFAIDPGVSKSGRDAYRIVSGDGVTITGSNVRSVWYGLYDLLERRGGCHWFWDGDVVPKKDGIDLSNLDVHEEARFEYRGLRYFAHRGLTRFQAEHWGPEDWKKEIDWILKRRLNVFMLRIGQDDLFQLAFPDVCKYPDPAKSTPWSGMGYNDRSLFWSLQFRGKLRRDLQKYGFDRGLMVPEDYGTMTHWYAPTPLDYLENRKPPFYPGADNRPANNRVWDVRDERWIDEYWKMTKTAVETYGRGAPKPQLLHTIGTGERILSTNKVENFKLKVDGLQRFMSRIERDYPEAKLLMPGWDFYHSWTPQEVKDFLKLLDPKKCIVWDYSADQKTARGARSNFMKWDVIGKFPYTYSIFLAYEKALDARADYPLIEARQKLVQNDPFCQGFIFWPESSHTDTLLLRYFTANAWSDKAIPHGEVLDEFCASRYGKNAEAMKAAWNAVLPASWLRDWTTTYADRILIGDLGDEKASRAPERWRKPVAEAEKVFGMLAKLEWKGDFIRRDTIDIARVALDRVICLRRADLSADVAKWRNGKGDGANLVARAKNIAALCDAMADLLALHTDYSLWESYLRLDAVEKIQNPDFSKTLFENASCPYCRSHQYELARHWYAAHARTIAENLEKAVASGDRSMKLSSPASPERIALKAKPLESLKPTLPRTEENFRKVMREVQELLD